jgi:hypothetical protein
MAKDVDFRAPGGRESLWRKNRVFMCGTIYEVSKQTIWIFLLRTYH